MLARLGRVKTLLHMVSCLIIALVALFPLTARAQGAREYLNTPVDQWSTYFESIFSRSQSAASAALPVPNDLAVSRVTVAYFLYSFPWRKKYAGVSIVNTFSRVRVNDGTIEKSGFGDPGIAFHANLFGLKALRKEELSQYVPKPLMSVHFTFNPPIGSYTRNSPVNVGGNRWSFSPLVNLNIPHDKGKGWIEFYASARFFTKNNAFQLNRSLSQKPITTLTGHYSHNFGKRYWASIGANYDYGGETSIDHVRQNNKANGFRPSTAVSGVFGRFRITVRYENTATTDAAHHRNGLIGIRVATLLF